MVNWLLEKVIGTHNERECKRLMPRVAQINALEPEMQKLSDEALRAKTEAFRSLLKERLSSHQFITPLDAQWYERNHDERDVLKKQRRKIQQEALNEILPQAFAVVREAARRRLNMRHFDVQLLGGMVLHEGTIAEMSTGEGKTLVATLAAYLNALTNRGVHIVTVNDYLARRDARWMGPIYHALGLSVGVIQGADPAERRQEESLSFIYDPTVVQGNDRFLHLRPATRQEAYLADITYGQNNEFGFDYLRDNMRFRREDLTQREFHFAIVDEVDSILIDEARTPLIISGPAEESTDLYFKLDKVVRRLDRQSHYDVEEKDHAVSLNEEGIKKCEELLGIENLYDEGQMRLLHHINQALRAHELYKRDVEYMVKDGEIIIVDEFTGRLMPGRRWSDGLHQAIEAKENVQIRQENQTLATVTFQNYFRMYEKLAGMTGTASTEAQEFKAIYNLDVVTIPTNRPMVRLNAPDVVFKTEEEKFIAVVQEIADLHRKGQPILIGTISIEKSEHLSRMLKEPGPFLKRLGTIAQMALEELKKEAEAGEELRKRLEHALTRPATLTPSLLEPLVADLKQGLPKSILVFRFEDMLRFARVIDMVKQGIRHNVLNAKYHEQEAKIIAQAGRKAALTIATNMAGRGTDILLGGNPQSLAEDFIREEETKKQAPLSEEEKKPVFERFKKQCDAEHDEVVAVGGLHVLGTERHEARRIDNQLRGRCGRQGDPGSSRFYLSLADDLMRIFGSDRIARLMDFKWFQWEEGMPIEHGMVTKAIETAQRRVEGQNFDTRKQLLEYDNTMNRQREVIYEQRRRILDGVDLQGLIRDVIAEVADELVDAFASKELRPDAWDLEALRNAASRQFGLTVPEETVQGERNAIADSLIELFEKAYEEKRKLIGPEMMAGLERTVMLSIIDAKWKDHLYMMDSLREGIHLRAYGQRDPIVEYQREAYQMFQDMTAAVKLETLTMLLRVQPAPAGDKGGPGPAVPISVFARTPQQELHPEASSELAQRMSPPAQQQPVEQDSLDEPGALTRQAGPTQSTTVKHEGPKVGRNDPCPCGSGQKYKKCHGK